jgi:hypothetical protein
MKYKSENGANIMYEIKIKELSQHVPLNTPEAGGGTKVETLPAKGYMSGGFSDRGCVCIEFYLKYIYI